MSTFYDYIHYLTSTRYKLANQNLYVVDSSGEIEFSVIYFIFKSKIEDTDCQVVLLLQQMYIMF